LRTTAVTYEFLTAALISKVLAQMEALQNP
jgi:hypothetical protein